MAETMNLFQKLNLIRSKVGYIKKDKAVENYKAVTHDAVVAETRQWFIEVGILVVPTLLRDNTLDTGAKSSKGNTLWRYEGTFDIRFIDCDDPTQILHVEVTAHANDYGDKAPGKAITYATKSAVLKALFLETGENDEARQTTNMAPGDEVTPEEMVPMLKAIKESATLESLLEVYATAFARCEKDKDAKDTIIQAKNARQIVLKGSAKLSGGSK